MDDNLIYQNDVLRVGVVISVRGRSTEILVDKTKNTPHLLFNGELIRNVSVGSYIKLNKGFERIIGIIESETIKEDKLFDSKNNYSQDKQKIHRVLQVKVIGYLDKGKFEQGVKELPLIDNVCYILTKYEYDQVHAFIKEGDVPITIGKLATETSKEISLGVNSLFASHIGIFGNTGSGKSYSLASLYHSLFKEFANKSGFKNNTMFLLIDFNGEYVRNTKGQNNIYYAGNKEIIDLPEKKIPVLRSSLENIEILSIMLDATEKTQRPFLNSCIDYSKFKTCNFCFNTFITEIIGHLLNKQDKEYGTKAFLNLFNDLYDCVESIDVIQDIKNLIYNELGHNTGSGSYYSLSVDKDPSKARGSSSSAYKEENLSYYFTNNIKTKINNLKFKQDHLLISFLTKIILKYHSDILNGHANIEHISPLIKRAKTVLLKLDNLIVVVENISFEKNLKIISLKNIQDNSLKKILALIICKEVYDNQKKNSDNKFLNIIIDEAHNILSPSSQRESESWKDYRLETFEEIIKEGRKFKTFLTIASQRPSDISSTIISQLHNYFLHRLINNKDIEAIEKTVSYLDQVSFESLPILPTGTCIIAGLAAKLPVVVKMNELDEEFQPNSQTIKLTDCWIDKSEITEDTPSSSDSDKFQVEDEEDYLSV